MLAKDNELLQNFYEATQYEWLETNGLGGWSGSSIAGAHTRRYHGLLVAAIVPPAERKVLLSKLDETIILNGQRIELGSNLYGGDVIYPMGNQQVKRFEKDFFPRWVYEAGGVQIRKTIAMVQGENTVLVLYDVITAPQPFTMELLPLMANRDYHSLAHAGPQMHWDVSFDKGIFHNKPGGNEDVFISVPGARYEHTLRWFNNFKYSAEEYRGLEHTEDLFNHGIFSIDLKEGDSIGIMVSTEDPAGREVHRLFQDEKKRREALLQQAGNKNAGTEKLDLAALLLLAADQFIVKRDQNLKTIIAGYHWFTDWGRDTMISLPGLCLATRRFNDAKKILAAFANSVSMGMLPNRFQDNGQQPEYNNVDGTLWYFVAVYKYLQATNDNEFVLEKILPVLKEILDWHHKGTRFHIHVTADGLLYSGEEGVQLTWMDAKVGEWVVTPRTGKAVEIQALWYNAQKMYAELQRLNNNEAEASLSEAGARLVKENFLIQFWNTQNNCLYDVVDEDAKDASVRPNQLFAISLPFPLVEGTQAAAILQLSKEKLYTPVGLRSLAPDDPRYIGTYGGDPWHRDSAYHQGTVWSWLLGAYIDAVMKVNGEKGRGLAIKIIGAFEYHLGEAGIGSVSEIFDGNAPHHPRGCIAQAWGVAELLRVITQYDLVDAKREMKMVEMAD